MLMALWVRNSDRTHRDDWFLAHTARGLSWEDSKAKGDWMAEVIWECFTPGS